MKQLLGLFFPPKSSKVITLITLQNTLISISANGNYCHLTANERDKTDPKNNGSVRLSTSIIVKII